MAEVMEMEVFKSGRPCSFLEFFLEVPSIPFLELLPGPSTWQAHIRYEGFLNVPSESTRRQSQQAGCLLKRKDFAQVDIVIISLCARHRDHRVAGLIWWPSRRWTFRL